MSANSAGSFRAGRHFLQIPGPTNVPDSVLRAMARPTIDHRGPEFQALTRRVLKGLSSVLGTRHPVALYPSSGTGAWEAALVNTLSPGDRVLMFETGHFAHLWRRLATRLGLEVEWIPGDWRRGVDPDAVATQLGADAAEGIQAVAIVHNETSTGTTSRIPEIRQAIDRVGHPALLMVDTISSLASMEYRHDDWQVDVAVGCSQKGLMLPPGLGLCAVSPRAIEAAATARMARSYWDWSPLLETLAEGFFPYTPPTHLLYGLDEALELLAAEGLEAVFRRHARLAEATRRAARRWELELVCAEPRELSSSVTALLLPDGHDADALRRGILDLFDVSLGTGLGQLEGRAFRIGHLGALNEPALLGTLAAVEMGLRRSGIPHAPGGTAAALEWLAAEETVEGDGGVAGADTTPGGVARC